MALPQGKGEPVSSEVPQLERMWYVGEVAQLNVLQAMIKSCQPCSLYSLQHNRKNHMLWSILMTFLTLSEAGATPQRPYKTHTLQEQVSHVHCVYVVLRYISTI